MSKKNSYVTHFVPQKYLQSEEVLSRDETRHVIDFMHFVIQLYACFYQTNIKNLKTNQLVYIS